MESHFISPKLDIVFKKLFTDDPESLKAFLSDMLDIPKGSIKALEYVDTEVKPALLSEKLSRLDLCINVDNKMIDIEIQIKNNKDFIQRALYYWARLYSSNLKIGEKYFQLRPTITLNILDYILFSSRTSYHAKTVPFFVDSHDVYSDHLEMHFYELPKVKFPLEKGDSLDKMDRRKLWLLFLNARNEEDLEMIYETNDDVLCKVIDHYRHLTQNDEFKLKALNREIEIFDHDSAIYNAKEEGREEGWNKGLEEGWNKGLEEGWNKGREEGWNKGREEGWNKGQDAGSDKRIVKAVQDLMHSMNCDIDSACQALNVSDEERKIIESSINKVQDKATNIE